MPEDASMQDHDRKVRNRETETCEAPSMVASELQLNAVLESPLNADIPSLSSYNLGDVRARKLYSSWSIGPISWCFYPHLSRFATYGGLSP